MGNAARNFIKSQEEIDEENVAPTTDLSTSDEAEGEEESDDDAE